LGNLEAKSATLNISHPLDVSAQCFAAGRTGENELASTVGQLRGRKSLDNPAYFHRGVTRVAPSPRLAPAIMLR
jgi:hypothetical protein